MHTEYYRRPDGFVFAARVEDKTAVQQLHDPVTGQFTGEFEVIEPVYEPPPGCVFVTEAEWQAVEPHYFQAPGGRVRDMWKRMGGDPVPYIENGWAEIDKPTFQKELVRLAEYDRKARAEWIEEMGEDGLREQGEKMDQFVYSMAARGATRKG